MRDDLRDGFTAWASGQRRALLRSAYLLTGDAHHAEDLVQQALVKVAVRWDRLHDENPDGYARTVMYRDHISWRRRRRDVVSSRQIEVGAASVDSDQSLVMAQALARLTAKQRAVLVLRFYDDLSQRDTAAALGVSAGTVKSQTSAALQRLRETAPEVRVLLGMEGERRD